MAVCINKYTNLSCGQLETKRNSWIGSQHKVLALHASAHVGTEWSCDQHHKIVIWVEISVCNCLRNNIYYYGLMYVNMPPTVMPIYR